MEKWETRCGCSLADIPPAVTRNSIPSLSSSKTFFDVPTTLHKISGGVTSSVPQESRGIPLQLFVCTVLGGYLVRSLLPGVHCSVKPPRTAYPHPRDWLDRLRIQARGRVFSYTRPSVSGCPRGEHSFLHIDGSLGDSGAHLSSKTTRIEHAQRSHCSGCGTRKRPALPCTDGIRQLQHQ